MISITLNVTPGEARKIIDLISGEQEKSTAQPATGNPPVQMPAEAGQASAPQQAPALPTSEQAYTQEQLALAATQILDAGRQNELIQLLGSFGVQALTQLPKENYGAFATSLRAMGARI